MSDPTKIEMLTPDPVLKLGKIGLFDDSAVFPSWLVRRGKAIYMYYVGWVQGVSAPYYASGGLAISRDGGRTFKRYSEAPIMGRSEKDPYINASNCVIRDRGLWAMWYLSAIDFRIEGSKSMYYYVIKYAESDDGLNWRRTGNVSIGLKEKGETRISRPCVIRDRDCYKMWYSYARDSYRIGYAESIDGKKWVRMDEKLGLTVSRSGWDDEMVCYPHVFDHGGRRFMLYNGNSYGKTGIGLATLEE
ncbi:MAG: hypothetical protein OK456_03460 [Thaumarchaeota archaeon]|nr:hypothetical protein [Nitrososphaerota archaeon]